MKRQGRAEPVESGGRPSASTDAGPGITRQRWERSDDRTAAGTDPEAAPEAEVLQSVLEGSVGVSFSEGNVVEVLEDEEGLHRLADDMRRARRSITFQVYYVEEGRVLDEFLEIFRERAEAGVSVRLLLDALGTKRLSRRRVQKLVGERVEVARLRPRRIRHPLRFLHRAHSRCCIVDGSVAYTGGFGLADRWDPAPGQGPAWRELSVRVTGPAALRLQSAFTALWAEARRGEVLKGSHLFPAEAVECDGHTTAGVLISAPSQVVSAAIRFLDVLTSEARRRLWIYSGYFGPGPAQRRLLQDAARRGVDVRVLTAGEPTDLPFVRLAGRGQYRNLLEAGVRIWEFQPRMLHAKAFVLDEHLAGIGSLNIDAVSPRFNDETALLTLDAALAGSLAATFERDLEQAAEIRLETLGRQPLPRRMLERAIGMLVRMS